MYQPTSIFEDPFLRFCYEVEKKNASRLAKIKTKRHFKIESQPEGDDSLIGFGKTFSHLHCVEGCVQALAEFDIAYWQRR